MPGNQLDSNLCSNSPGLPLEFFRMTLELLGPFKISSNIHFHIRKKYYNYAHSQCEEGTEKSTWNKNFVLLRKTREYQSSPDLNHEVEVTSYNGFWLPLPYLQREKHGTVQNLRSGFHVCTYVMISDLVQSFRSGFTFGKIPDISSAPQFFQQLSMTEVTYLKHHTACNHLYMRHA